MTDKCTGRPNRIWNPPKKTTWKPVKKEFRIHVFRIQVQLGTDWSMTGSTDMTWIDRYWIDWIDRLTGFDLHSPVECLTLPDYNLACAFYYSWGKSASIELRIHNCVMTKYSKETFTFEWLFSSMVITIERLILLIDLMDSWIWPIDRYLTQINQSNQSVKSISQINQSNQSVKSISQIDQSNRSVKSISQIDQIYQSNLSVKSIGQIYQSNRSVSQIK
jgi:hypothetical protein